MLTLTALQTNPQNQKDTHIHVKRDSDVLSPLPQVSQWDNNLEPSNEFQFLFDASLINRPTFGSNIPCMMFFERHIKKSYLIYGFDFGHWLSEGPFNGDGVVSLFSRGERPGKGNGSTSED